CRVVIPLKLKARSDAASKRFISRFLWKIAEGHHYKGGVLCCKRIKSNFDILFGIKKALARRAFYSYAGLHIWIVRAASTFWWCPSNVLCGILNVTGFAVHTVLRVNLEFLLTAFLGDDFIHTSWA